MKNPLFRRIISLTLCVILALSCFSITAVAANELTVKVAPAKTVFYQGEDWNYVDGKISLVGGIDLSGIKLSYGARTISYTIDDVFGPNIYAKSATGTWVAGNNTARIYCDEVGSTSYATLTFRFVSANKIEIKEEPALKDLISTIHWNKSVLGDVEISSYDMTGLQIEVTYSDSTTKTLSAPNTAITWSVDPNVDSIKPGPNKMYISYASKSTSFDVNYIELGDVNSDLKISSLDALLVLEYAVNISDLTDTQLLLANVNKDTNVNSTDALNILQYVVGLKTSF